MRRSCLPSVLALAAVLLIVYAPGILAPASYDTTLLLDSPKTSSTALVLKGFLSPNDPYLAMYDYAYRPLTELSFSLSWAVRPSLPWLWAGNLVLHLIASVLVLLLARRLGLEGGFPLLASLFFALHPLAVQAVTYVYQRSTVLEALFAFLALLLYDRGALLLALASAFLAALSKETGGTLPLTAGALAWIYRDRFAKSGRGWCLFCLPALLVLVQVLRAHELARAAGGGVFRDIAGRSPLEYLLVELSILWHYLRLAAWPWPLHFAYGNPWADPLKVSLAGAGLLALGGWVLFGPERHRLPRLGAALFFAPLSMESSIFPIRDIAFDHRCYPGLLGAALLFAWGASRLRRALPPAISALLLLGVLAAHQNRVWGSVAGLVARDVRCAPDASQMRAALASRIQRSGDLARAERIYRVAIRSPRQTPNAMIGLARTLGLQGNLEEAALRSLQVADAFPRDPDSLYEALRWAEALAGKGGDRRRLEELISRVRSLGFRGIGWSLAFAHQLADLDRQGAAEEVLRAGLQRAPEEPRLLEFLGTVLINRGKLEQAERVCHQALSLDPGRPKTYHNLACILAARGDFQGAEGMLEEALRLKPDYRKAADDLAALREHQRLRAP